MDWDRRANHAREHILHPQIWKLQNANTLKKPTNARVIWRYQKTRELLSPPPGKDAAIFITFCWQHEWCLPAYMYQLGPKKLLCSSCPSQGQHSWHTLLTASLTPHPSTHLGRDMVQEALKAFLLRPCHPLLNLFLLSTRLINTACMKIPIQLHSQHAHLLSLLLAHSQYWLWFKVLWQEEMPQRKLTPAFVDTASLWSSFP